MPDWVKLVFLVRLPALLFMQRPRGNSARRRLRDPGSPLLGFANPRKSGMSSSASALLAASSALSSPGHYYSRGPQIQQGDRRPVGFLPDGHNSTQDLRGSRPATDWGSEIQEAVDGVRYVADHMMGNDDDQSVSDFIASQVKSQQGCIYLVIKTVKIVEYYYNLKYLFSVLISVNCN